VVLNQATPRTPRLQRKNGGSIPTIEEEDAKRPNREREKLVSDRTRIINRMKSNFPVEVTAPGPGCVNTRGDDVIPL
jgi:hypothetical protein